MLKLQTGLHALENVDNDIDIDWLREGEAVASLVEALCYKPVGSIPDEVTGFFD
jgi:hypothetical protein